MIMDSMISIGTRGDGNVGSIWTAVCDERATREQADPLWFIFCVVLDGAVRIEAGEVVVREEDECA